MLTVTAVLIVLAFALTLAHALDKCPPLWIPVFLLSLAELLRVVPLGR